MADHTRRRFLRLTGVAGAGAALGTLPVSAKGEKQRFLIDLKEIDRSEVPESVEIVHDLSEIDVLAAAGDPSEVGGSAATAPDVELHLHDDEEDDEGGPAREHDDDDEDDDDDDDDEEGTGLPDRRTLQWDKHAQELEEEVHEVTRGEGSRLAVIDSGVYADHPDLDGVVNRELSRSFVGDGNDFNPNGAGDHGTHVAGTVAATNDYDGERGGVLGTAPETDLLALRVFGATGGAATGDVAAAIMYAADEGCDAANLSLGFPTPYVYPDEYPFLVQVREVYERAVRYANERGTAVVNSAGNSAIDLDPEGTLGLPTEAEGVFAVSATGPIGYVWDDEFEEEIEAEEALEAENLREPTTQPAKYTSYGGTVVDVSAGGGNYDPEALAEADDGDADNPKWFYDLVISTVTPGEDGGTNYGFKAGTSMAAPQVTGAIGLARSLRPELGVREVEDLIRNTASDIGEPDYRGDGHLDLTALLEALEEDEDEEEDGESEEYEDEDEEEDGESEEYGEEEEDEDDEEDGEEEEDEDEEDDD